MKEKIWHFPLKAVDNLLDRVFSILGAFFLVQFPQFFSLYIQRLGGHLDEARHTINLYSYTANSLRLTLNQFIESHLVAENPVFIGSGEQIAQMTERFYSLEKGLTNLINATPFTRLWVFLSEADWGIAAQVWRNFTPGIPTNLEGVLYALLGLGLGWGLYSVGKVFFRLSFSVFREKRNTKKEYSLEA